MNNYENVDEYIANFPPDTQIILNRVRQTIKKALPDATEKMSYGIPTYRRKKNLIHFGGYKHHIGFYPGTTAVTHFSKELKGYKTSKGTVQFPLTKPMPYDLIRKICDFQDGNQTS